MLNLVRLYDIDIQYTDDIYGFVKSAKADILCEVDDDFNEIDILELRESYYEDLNDNTDSIFSIFVIWDMSQETVRCEYVVFDDSIDVAEWEYRIYSSVAAEQMGLNFEV